MRMKMKISILVCLMMIRLEIDMPWKGKELPSEVEYENQES